MYAKASTRVSTALSPQVIRTPCYLHIQNGGSFAGPLVQLVHMNAYKGPLYEARDRGHHYFWQYPSTVGIPGSPKKAAAKGGDLPPRPSSFAWGDSHAGV
jgi:hypothetical protein